MDRKEFLNKISQVGRMVFVALLMLSLAFGCVIRLLQIQIADTYGFSVEPPNPTRTVTQSIQAVRGQIADSQGRLLNTNETVHKVILQRAFLPFQGEGEIGENEVIAGVLDVLIRHEEEWIDNIPVSPTPKFRFINVPQDDMDDFKNKIGVNYDATVKNCINALAKNYKIDSDKYDEQMIRYIGGIRYEMETMDFSFQNRYVLAEDVSMDVIIELMEMTLLLPGVDVVQEPIRVYNDGTALAHIRGRMTSISAEQYELLRDSGYSRNDTIGLYGIEESMESTLRGKNGILEITRDSLWEIISAETTREAQAGNSVKLTIDTEFQRMAEGIIQNHVDHINRHTGPGRPNSEINRYPTPEGATSGALVVMDVHTGAILAMANYPTYDVNDYIDLLLMENSGEPLPNAPLRDRCGEWGFRPGSTFKIITSVVGLMQGAITKDSRISCGGRYHLYNKPQCWGGSACGSNSISDALCVSCNVFYYETGRRIGDETLAEEATRLFGIGTDLNIDIRSGTGRMTSPELYYNLIGQPMGGADLIQAAIGQSETLLTPIQMATAAATVANGGVRLRPYLVDSVWNYDYTELIDEIKPQIVVDFREGNEETFALTQLGMKKRAAMDSKYFAELPIKPAYKTGTPELYGNYNNSAVVGFYPADNPQIAFSVVIEGGDKAFKAIPNIIHAYHYGEFEPVGEELSIYFHKPLSEGAKQIKGRVADVNPWVKQPETVE
ncbi:MAG: penicillin-binding transpeptidase domain-containing protein [Oscillospiraceae bacterium]|nr:penicillin-binding transpeptidase domain-containing protein [Oscillospiraceae bacterium]